MADINVSEIAKRLWDIVQLDHCVVWIGSGLSFPARYPDWHRTVATLCIACQVDALADLSSLGDALLAKADECKQANPDAYHQVLRDTFGHASEVLPMNYINLAALPFRAFVTTNFDPMLEMAVNRSPKKGVLRQYPILPVTHLSGNERVIYYAHGRARNGEGPCGENLVLGKSEFDAAYQPAGPTSVLLSSILTHNHVLFLGCSLLEPPVQKLLALVKEVQANMRSSEKRWPARRRIIVLPPKFEERTNDNSGEKIRVPHEASEKKEESYFKEFEIDILRYGSDSPDDHKPLQQALEILCELAQQPSHLEAKIDLGEELPTP